MGVGTLTIYSASAGSGKTFRLAGNYLKLIFTGKYHYRKILAVTFTNKSTAEMKSRILDQLYRLASGVHSEYLKDLSESTGKQEETIRREAREILLSILHDYSRFSVCTIDAFFQKIIRAFTRECGLNSGFSIEIDHNLILSLAVDETIKSSATDPKLGNWLTQYVFSNLDEEKSWNIRKEIVKLSEELFKEKFKILSSQEINKLGNKDFLLDYINKLKVLKFSFENTMRDLGKRALAFFTDYQLTDEMFYNKSRGVPGYLRSLADGRINKPNEKVRSICDDPPRWSTGKLSQDLQNAIEAGFGDIVKEAIKQNDENIIAYKTANSILNDIYALGILSDIISKVHHLTTDNNMFLLSDAGELLSLITGSDQTPFIYEKIGNRYENYMIDEFQDTSILQWKNFQPLINNSMSEGFDNLVVGDIKQSIYRFRNSDWRILGGMLEKDIDSSRIRSVSLNYNFRSRSNIISFNNSLFSLIPDLIDQNFPDDYGFPKFKRLYSEAVQTDPRKASGGYVRIDFIDDVGTIDEENDGQLISCEVFQPVKQISWKNKVLEKIPGIIESILEKGYNLSDIGILVRDGREGAEVLQTVIEYSYSASDGKANKRDLNIISNDSLIISNSDAISFIISVLKIIIDPKDFLSRALMLRSYLFAIGWKDPEQVELTKENLTEKLSDYLPEGFEKFLDKIGQLPLFEASEEIIGFFNLGSYSWNVPYLVAFQDLILDYSRNKDSDFKSFLDWWEITGSSKSLILPSGMDAIKVLTIHKSKGLEFPVVLLPFLSWNLDHKHTKRPYLWVKPSVAPFDDLGIVPVRYSSDLEETIFSKNYYEERYSSFLDNINLLYVAMTRAIDVLYAFAPENPGPANGIAKVIRSALSIEMNYAGEKGINLSSFYKQEEKRFELGVIPEHKAILNGEKNLKLKKYKVIKRPQSLKLKLHSTGFFPDRHEQIDFMRKYGILMHEVFESINTIDDVESAVKRMVMDGRMEENESGSVIIKIKELISDPAVSSWFKPGCTIIKETGILLPDGEIRRPDRVIIREGKATVVDFKFGAENPDYFDQLNLYKNLLMHMGYENIEAYIWYVDSNKIIRI